MAKETGTKRILALLLCMAMVLSMLPTAAFAEGETDACTNAADCAATTHEAGCPKYVAPVATCTKTADCAATNHEADCPKYVAPVATCTKTADCAATNHEEGCPRYVAPVATCDKTETCVAATHEEDCPKYVPTVVSCTKSDDCAAETHEEGCPKYAAPVVTCTKAEECTAETHEEGCPKYAAPVVKCTKAEDCAAETHEEGCPKYAAPVVTCTKAAECAAETHEEGCPKYAAACTKALDCAAVTHEQGCLKAIQEMIDALPAEDELTEDNIQQVKEQIAAIETNREGLTEEQWSSLDHKAYDDIKTLLSALEEAQILLDPVAEVSGTTYATLHEALENADGGATIKLLDHVDWNAETTAGGTEVVDISNCTLDLNGKTLSATNFSLVFQGENVSILNGAFNSKGESYGLFIGDEGTTNHFVVNNVTLSGGINIYNASNVILKNVKVTGTNYYAIWCDKNAKAVLESGTIQSNGNAVLGLWPDNTELLIRGGAFYENGKPLVLASGSTTQYGTPVITGGTFSSDVSAYVPDGYDAVLADGRYSVGRATQQQEAHVAEVDGLYYKSLKNAVAAAGGKTVKLLKNVTLTEDLAVGQAEAITLDLGGFTIDGGDYQIYTQDVGTVTFTGNGTIRNSNAGTTADTAPLRIYSGSNVVLDGVTVSGEFYAVKNSGNLTVTRAEITGAKFGVACFGSSTTNIGQSGGAVSVTTGWQAIGSAASTGESGMTVNVYGGTFQTTGTEWDEGPVYWAGHGTLNIYGGSFRNATSGTGAAALLQKNGTVNVYGGSFSAKDGIKIAAQSDSTEITTNLHSGSFTGSRSGIYIDASSSANMGKLSAYSVSICEGATAVFTGGSEGAIYTKEDGLGSWSAVLTVAGGSFNTPVEERHCAQDYVPVEKDSGVYGVKLITHSVTLTYDAGDETEGPEPETKEIRNNGTAEFTVSDTVPVRDGYQFLGWKAETADSVYKAGDTVTVEAVTEDTQITLTAQWLQIRGFCGDPNVNDGKDVTWALTENPDAPGTYTLTISGSGDMADFNSGTSVTNSDRPWISVRSKISSVCVGEGIRYIGAYSFANFSILKNVSLPESLNTIGNNAFYYAGGSAGIENLRFPANLKKIAFGAFTTCVVKQDVVEIPASVNSIGSQALQFRNTSSVSLIRVKSPTLTVANNAFGFGATVLDLSRVSAMTKEGNVHYLAQTCKNTLAYVSQEEYVAWFDALGTHIKAVAVTNGGVIPEDFEVSAQTLATPVKTGSIFGGWYESADFAGSAVTAAQAGKTYYAKWTECTHETTEKTCTAQDAVLTQSCACGVVTGTATLTAPEELVYSQTAKEAAVTLSSGWKGQTPAIVYTSGETVLDGAPVNAGSYTAVITQGSASASVEYVISKANQTLAFEASGITLYRSALPFTNTLTHSVGDGAVTYASGNEKIATVSSAGVVTLVGPGSVMISATAAETANYKQAKAAYVLTVKENPASPVEELTGEKILVSAAVSSGQESAMNTAIAASFSTEFAGKELWMVDVQLIDTTSGNPIHDEKVTFYLAYPAGITAANYKEYSYLVLHLKEDGNTELIPATATDKGLKITSTLSPFTVGYSRNAEETFTLHFDANGGRKAPGDQTVSTRSGSGSIVISGTKPTRSGYTFKGWSTTEKGRVEYKSGDTVVLTGDTTLYAVWSASADSPGTGDTLNLTLWLSVMGISALALAAAVLIVVKKKK